MAEKPIMKSETVLFTEEAWLHDLDFVDLYISLDEERPSYYQANNRDTLLVVPRDLPSAYHTDVMQLREEVKRALRSSDEAALTFDGMRLRASKSVNLRGEAWVSLRRIPLKPPSIDDLGFTASITRALKEMGKRSGLILICGGTGQGKTTTAASLLNAYLHQYGGLAYTIEDPVEYVLDGRHGKTGLCYQVEVQDDADWAPFLKRSLRWHPRYIMLGELRTPEAANQLLRAANSGHLVITTMHAGSLEEGLEGLLHLGELAIGELASTLLAAGLTVVMHQTFKSHTVHARFYETDEGNLGEPVRALIRERQIGQATTFIDRQMARRDASFK